MDIYSKEQKRLAIKCWKERGLIYHDYDDLFQVYIKTLNCQHCNKEFKNRQDRHMDHNHETGLFRKIVCHRCNTCDFYINHPDGIPTNRNDKINCDCGSIISIRNIARHKRTAKHIDWWLNNVD